jgi:hypothetical protein
MKKYQSALGLIMALLFASPAWAQIEYEISDAAAAYARAHIREDFEALLNFTYPDLIEKAGSREDMKKTLILIKENQKKNGLNLQSYKVKDQITFSKVGQEIHAIVPITTISKAPGGRLTQESFLIAVRPESNGNWYFIETTLLDERNLPKVIPSWDNSLMLPNKQAPIFKEER